MKNTHRGWWLSAGLNLEVWPQTSNYYFIHQSIYPPSISASEGTQCYQGLLKLAVIDWQTALWTNYQLIWLKLSSFWRKKILHIYNKNIFYYIYVIKNKYDISGTLGHMTSTQTLATIILVSTFVFSASNSLQLLYWKILENFSTLTQKVTRNPKTHYESEWFWWSCLSWPSWAPGFSRWHPFSVNPVHWTHSESNSDTNYIAVSMLTLTVFWVTLATLAVFTLQNPHEYFLQRSIVHMTS